MQRLIERTKHAQRQAQRHAKKLSDRKEVEDKYKRRQEELRLLRTNSKYIREARINRRQDWDTGALAPRRDVGEQADKYATLSVYDMRLAKKREKEQLGWMHIRQGDRVVVTRGREKGRIGVVDKVAKERMSLQIDDVNVADLYIPDFVPREEGNKRNIVPYAMPLPISDVKLVYPIPDPDTGIPKDTIIDRLIPVNREKNVSGEMGAGDRAIPGTNIIIPWPEEPDEYHEDHEDDTVRYDVEEQTFQPMLIRPPMPLSVIDELRNKFSKFRTRHDHDFLEKMRSIDEREERRKNLGKSMRTPLQELAELRARQKVAEERELSKDQLAKIGEVIAAEREKVKSAVRRSSSPV